MACASKLYQIVVQLDPALLFQRLFNISQTNDIRIKDVLDQENYVSIHKTYGVKVNKYAGFAFTYRIAKIVFDGYKVGVILIQRNIFAVVPIACMPQSMLTQMWFLQGIGKIFGDNLQRKRNSLNLIEETLFEYGSSVRRMGVGVGVGIVLTVVQKSTSILYSM